MDNEEFFFRQMIALRFEQEYETSYKWQMLVGDRPIQKGYISPSKWTSDGYNVDIDVVIPSTTFTEESSTRVTARDWIKKLVIHAALERNIYQVTTNEAGK